MYDAKMRRELELQTRSVLEDQFSRVSLAGVRIDYVTTPEDPPAWIGTEFPGKQGTAFRFHETDPAVWLTIGEGMMHELRHRLEETPSEIDPVGAFDNIIEPIICNSGLQQIPPHEAGLTSNPFVLSDEVDRTDRGELRNLGRLICFEPYQTQCPIEALAEDGRVRFEIKV